MAAVTLTAKLVDKVSAPANKAAKAINKVSRAAGKVDKAGRIGKAAKGLKKVDTAASGAGSSLAGATMKGNLMAGAVMKVADMAKQAAAAVAKLALAFGKAVGKAALFGESLQFSLTRFLGSSARAKKEIASVLKLSNKLGLDFQESAALFKSLVSAGFTTEASKGMIAWKADLLALNVEGAKGIEKVGAAFGHIEKAMAQGRMEADGFQEVIKNLPINKLQIMEQLSKKMNKPIAELMKMDITKLPVDKLLASMQDAALKGAKATKLGETALQRQKQTVGGMISLIKAKVGNIPDMIATKLEGAGLKDILDDVLSALDSPEAKVMLDAIVAAMKNLGASAKAAWAAIGPIASSIGSVTASMQSLNAQMKELTGADTGALSFMLHVFKAIAIAIGVVVAAAALAAYIIMLPFIAAYDAIMIVWEGIKAGADALISPMVSLGSTISGAFSSAWASLKSFASGFLNLGGDMMAGLVEGIKAAAGAVVKAITGVVGAGIDAAKGALGMRSPSKVFAHMGAMSALGYVEGFEDVGVNIPAMSASAVTPSFGGGANVTQNNSNTFNVTEAQSAEDTARMVKRMQLMEMASAFEQMAVEIGG